jgi:hypothetical protein
MQVKTASISNPEHYVNIARKLASDTPGAVFMDQFESEANFKVKHLLISDATRPVAYELLSRMHVCAVIRSLRGFERARALLHVKSQRATAIECHTVAFVSLYHTPAYAL